MKNKFYVMVGSIVAMWICYEIYQLTYISWILYAGFVGMLVGIVNLFLGGISFGDNDDSILLGVIRVFTEPITQEDVDALYNQVDIEANDDPDYYDELHRNGSMGWLDGTSPEPEYRLTDENGQMWKGYKWVDHNQETQVVWEKTV